MIMFLGLYLYALDKFATSIQEALETLSSFMTWRALVKLLRDDARGGNDKRK